jgi:hypothetical protein
MEKKMKRCSDCKFAQPLNRDVSIEKWEARAEKLAKQIEEAEKEAAQPKKGFFRLLFGDGDPPMMYPPPDKWDNIRNLRWRQMETFQAISDLKSKVECRRFPEAKEVNNNYFCGEFSRIDEMDRKIRYE